MDKTIEFEDLMDCVRYHDLGVSEKYILTLDGKRHVLTDTNEVVPTAKKQGYTVLMDGEEM